MYELFLATFFVLNGLGTVNLQSKDRLLCDSTIISKAKCPSLEHMPTFIYLAYSIIAFLNETVPAFEDTWIECCTILLQ